MRRWAIVPSIGFAAFIAGFLAASFSALRSAALPLAGAGFVAFAAGLLALQFFVVRCPSCSGALGRIAASFPGFPFRFSKRIRFCPYCGLDLDTALDAVTRAVG
jgi:hypothetical protein